MGVIRAAVELPLLLIDPDMGDMGENVSSRRRIPGLGRTTPPARGGAVGTDVGWCRRYDDCCWMCGFCIVA